MTLKAFVLSSTLVVGGILSATSAVAALVPLPDVVQTQVTQAATAEQIADIIAQSDPALASSIILTAVESGIPVGDVFVAIIQRAPQAGDLSNFTLAGVAAAAVEAAPTEVSTIIEAGATALSLTEGGGQATNYNVSVEFMSGIVAGAEAAYGANNPEVIAVLQGAANSFSPFLAESELQPFAAATAAATSNPNDSVESFIPEAIQTEAIPGLGNPLINDAVQTIISTPSAG